MDEPRVLVLADDRPGNVAQAVGVAEALGEPFRQLDITYDRFGRLPNLLRGASLFGAAACRAAISPPWPRLVIGAGRRTAPIARWFKHRHGARLVQIMDPGWPGREDFDLIAVPMHDDAAPPRPNVLRTLGSCHRAVPRLLETERQHWQRRLAELPRPYLLLVVGGKTKDYDFGADRAAQLVEQTLALSRQMGGSILATTSRRTEPEVAAVLAGGLPEPRYLHLWRPEGENPYLAFLSMADAIAVTGDSMNMCSEACANGGPVYIFSPEGMVNEKHARLHRMLFDQGYAKPLGTPFAPWRHPPLNAALDVAGEIRARGLLAD